jgi:phytoene synthase
VTEPDRALVAASERVLATRARSFRWGAVFLPRAARAEAAVVYAFCRLVDDLADDAPDVETAARALEAVRAELVGDAPARPLIAAYGQICAARGVGTGPALDLLRGMQNDLRPVRVPDDAALLDYCYCVAGTVGLMMCGVLGVTAPAASGPAIALGQAMQLTNICRDVAEDAGLGRVYLPAARLAARGVTPDEVLAGTADRRAVAAVVADLLALADARYQAAEAGMHHIPARARVAILVAARLYRAIGARIARQSYDPWRGRAVVPWTTKLLLVGRALLDVPSIRPAGHVEGMTT